MSPPAQPSTDGSNLHAWGHVQRAPRRVVVAADEAGRTKNDAAPGGGRGWLVHADRNPGRFSVSPSPL